MPQFNQKFCDKCGAAAITSCPECETPIRGYYNSGGITLSRYTPPAFCYKCGKPFPWTTGAIDAAKELAALLEGLSSAERQELAGSLDDLIRNTPKAPVAQAKFKLLMKKAGKEGYEGLKAVLIEVLSESARKALYGA